MLGLLTIDCVTRLAGLDGAVAVSDGDVHSFESSIKIFDVLVYVIDVLGQHHKFLKVQTIAFLSGHSRVLFLLVVKPCVVT